MSVHSRIINQANVWLCLKSTKPAGKAERREQSDQLVLKAANSAASAGAGAKEPPGEGKGDKCRRDGSRGQGRGQIPGLTGCRCGLGPAGSFPQDPRPLRELQPRRLLGVLSAKPKTSQPDHKLDLMAMFMEYCTMCQPVRALLSPFHR